MPFNVVGEPQSYCEVEVLAPTEALFAGNDSADLTVEVFFVATTTKTKLTPREIATQWGISVERVLCWIHTGELRAINAGTTNSGRKPRYLVDLEDLAAFERARAMPGPPVPIRRRLRKPAGKYFP